MADSYPVVVRGLRGSKTVEIDAPDRPDSDFANVIDILTERVRESTEKPLRIIPSSTRVGTLRVTDAGEFEFSAVDGGSSFGPLSPQTGGQSTLGGDTGDDSPPPAQAPGRRRPTDREQLDLTTAGQTDPNAGQSRLGGFDGGGGGGGGGEQTDRRQSGPSTDRGQSGLDQYTADRQEATEAVREKGIDGENFGDVDVREERTETPGEGIDGPERDSIERVIRATAEDAPRAVEMRRIGLDDSTIAAAVSELESQLRAPLSAYNEGQSLATATFAPDGDRLIEIELDVDPMEDDARAREAAAAGTDVPDPEQPPDGWVYAPASSAGETVERWRSAVEFDGTPVAQVTIDTVTDGGYSVMVSGLSADSLRQGRTVYRNEPQRLPDDVAKSMALPIESREQALFRAFTAMENFDTEKYKRDRFGQEIDARKLPDGTELQTGDVISITYQSNRGGGEDSIDGRIVSLSIPGGQGIELTRDRLWDAARNEVRVDGTKVGDTPDGPAAISVVDTDRSTDGPQSQDERLAALIDAASDDVDGYGDRVSADADVRRTFGEFDLDAGMWSERQSQDVFRFGIDVADMLERWREDFEAERNHSPDEIGEYVRALISALESITESDAGGGDGGGGTQQTPVDDRDPFADASRPTDVQPRDYPEPGEFSLRTVERDRVEWVRTTNTMRQRQGITAGGGSEEVPVEGRQRVAVREADDGSWRVTRATEYFRDGSFTRLGSGSTISELGPDAFESAVEIAVDEMEAKSGTEYGLIPIGVDVEPDSSTFDDFGGGGGA